MTVSVGVSQCPRSIVPIPTFDLVPYPQPEQLAIIKRSSRLIDLQMTLKD